MSKTQDEIQRVLELDAAATPGPWEEVWNKETGEYGTVLSEYLTGLVANLHGTKLYVFRWDDDYGHDSTYDFRLAAEYRTLAPLLARKLERAMRALSHTYHCDRCLLAGQADALAEIEAME